MRPELELGMALQLGCRQGSVAEGAFRSPRAAEAQQRKAVLQMEQRTIPLWLVGSPYARQQVRPALMAQVLREKQILVPMMEPLWLHPQRELGQGPEIVSQDLVMVGLVCHQLGV